MNTLQLLKENIALFEKVGARLGQAGLTYTVHPSEPITGGTSLVRGTYAAGLHLLLWEIECLNKEGQVSLLFRMQLTHGPSTIEVVRLREGWFCSWRLLNQWPTGAQLIFSRFAGLPKTKTTVVTGLPLTEEDGRINATYLMHAVMPEDDIETPPYGTPLPTER